MLLDNLYMIHVILFQTNKNNICDLVLFCKIHTPFFLACEIDGLLFRAFFTLMDLFEIRWLVIKLKIYDSHRNSDRS